MHFQLGLITDCCCPSEWRNKLGQALSEYIPLCAGVSIPLRDRLEALQKDFNLYGHDGEKSLEDTMMENVNISALEFESNVLDGVIINSRAGPYIYVNALVCAFFPSHLLLCVC